MRTIEPEMIPAMAKALAEYPSNGNPNMDDPTVQLLREFGLIEEDHTTKLCPACGTERPGHYWWKITPAGRVFMFASGWAL